MSKISGPLLDRIDIRIDVPAVKFKELASDSIAECSSAIRERVVGARKIQQERFRGEGIFSNAQMSPRLIRKRCARCVDSSKVASADLYFSSMFSPTDAGEGRASILASRIESHRPQVKATAFEKPVTGDDDLSEIVKGADFIINCLDPGQSSTAYKLNRVCLTLGIAWTSCSLDGAEVSIGPTIRPFETACYLCYKMRSVSCAGNPEDEFAFLLESGRSRLASELEDRSLGNVDADLDLSVDQLAKAGCRILYSDLTTPDVGDYGRMWEYARS